MPAGAREALIAWLGKGDTRRPVTVKKPPEGKVEAAARVESDVKAGSIVLVGEKRRFTLAWTEKDEARARAIPPGRYALRAVRLIRESKGASWVRSSTSPRREPTDFPAGRTTRLEAGGAVHLKARATKKKGMLRLGFALVTEQGAGASVFRDGKRIRVGYELLDGAGRKLASGTMKYG